LTRRAVPPSNLTLLGLSPHMTLVEVRWFDVALVDSNTPLPYCSEAERDAEFNDFTWARPEEVAEMFVVACDRSRELARSLSLDAPTVKTGRDNLIDLRWIYTHMIEEYARHHGHADLPREVIDGTTGI
jgi:hypothetical protein